jgi:hypothetical protein
MSAPTTPEEYLLKLADYGVAPYMTAPVLDFLKENVTDDRVVLHSARIAYRTVKRYGGSLLERESLATIALLHDLLEDADDPLGAAVGMLADGLVNSTDADAILRLTRRKEDTDETYFMRLSILEAGRDQTARKYATIVKIEDSWDNLKDAWTDFGPRRHVKFAMKVARFVLPWAEMFIPDLAREMKNELARILVRVPVK